MEEGTNIRDRGKNSYSVIDFSEKQTNKTVNVESKEKVNLGGGGGWI